MDNEGVAKELVAVAKLLTASDKLFVVKQGNTYTLWFSYAPGSGTTAIFRGAPEGFITDKSGHKNYNSLAQRFAKKFPANRVIPMNLYDYVSDQSRYDVFGGEVKPMKKMYVVIKKDDNIVVNFFDKKGEASYWAKN